MLVQSTLWCSEPRVGQPAWNRLLPIFAGLASVWLAGTGAAQPLAIVETDEAVTVTQHQTVVLAYNKVSPPAPSGIDSVYERSGCLHPVNTPRGRTVTEMFPVDHPHQHGIFSAWVSTSYDGRAVDFWNLAGRTGRVLHKRVVQTFQTDDATGFEVELIHRAEAVPAIDILLEHWKITVYPTDGTYRCFDLETTQRNITDKPLLVNRHHYGGIVLRGLTRWLTAEDADTRQQPDHAREPSGLVNDLGSNRVEGNHQHARWLALYGEIDRQPVSIAVLCHGENFRAPQAARLHPTKPYFCFAPCVDGHFVIDREHPYHARYRYLVTDAAPDAAWIDQQWQSWSGTAIPEPDRTNSKL